MLTQRSVRWLMWLLAVAAVMISGPVLRAQDQVRRIFLQLEDGAAQPVAPQYWLGVVCEEPTAVLRHHVGLKDGQGLVVAEIVDDSPAAEKLKVHDILLAIGELPLESVQQLSDAVNKSAGEEVTLSVQRGPGERVTVKLTPAKRPAHLAGIVGPGGEDVWRELRPMFDRFRAVPGDPLRMRIIQPGVIDQEKVAHDFRIHVGRIGDLPDGLSVTVNKDGDKPAKIKVQRGEQSWETTEDKLDALPKDIRAHVEGILHPGLPFTQQGAIRFEATPHVEMKPRMPSGPGIRAQIIQQPEFEQRFKALEEKIEALQRLIERQSSSDKE